jgi:hypothetical protein
MKPSEPRAARDTRGRYQAPSRRRAAARHGGRWWCCRSCAGVPFGDSLPAFAGLLLALQPFVLLADPAHQIGVRRARSLKVWPVRRCSRHDRTSAPIRFNASLLIAGRKLLKLSLRVRREHRSECGIGAGRGVGLGYLSDGRAFAPSGDPATGFLACSCPLNLSAPGKPSDPRKSLQSFPAVPGI